ncbi:hypothetical protein L7F22_066822 [Adiantum nelumboides]|nr:hypothetical protein [Adiantum nelumboides]
MLTASSYFIVHVGGIEEAAPYCFNIQGSFFVLNGSDIKAPSSYNAYAITQDNNEEPSLVPLQNVGKDENSPLYMLVEYVAFVDHIDLSSTSPLARKKEEIVIVDLTSDDEAINNDRVEHQKVSIAKVIDCDSPKVKTNTGFHYFGKKKSFYDLSSKLAGLAISVLKKVLRRLQQSSYRPNVSIILQDLKGLIERPVEYSYSSIASATKSFNNAIGEGGFSKVYKGALPQNGSTHKAEGRHNMQIAVKVLEMKSKHMKNQLLNELGTIAQIHHVNIARLLGFCMQEDHKILVYEYVANGALDK